MSKMLNLQGQKFGKLTILYREGENSAGRFTWKCKCDCGNITYATSNQMKTNRKLSCGCSKKLPKGEGSLNWIYSSYKRGAKKRELIFDLSKDQFKDITSKYCFYCGKPPRNYITYYKANGQYLCNGVDRLDNSKGYTIDNVVPCCDECNKAKGTRSKKDFYEWIDRVYHHTHPNVLSAQISYGDGTAEWWSSRFMEKNR